MESRRAANRQYTRLLLLAFELLNPALNLSEPGYIGRQLRASLEIFDGAIRVARTIIGQAALTSWPVFRAGYTYGETVLHNAEYAASHPGHRPSMAGLYHDDYVIQATEMP